MNSIIRTLANASLNEKKFEDKLDNLIEELDKVKVNDTGRNWAELCQNYANLNYLLKYIAHSNLISPKFMKILKKILVELDTIHQRYLNEINWSSPLEYFEGILDLITPFRYPDDYIEIKELFEKSLVEKNQINKLETICEAYLMLIQILEDVKRQCVSLKVDVTFEKKIKKCE